MSASHSPAHIVPRHGRDFEGSRLSIQVRLTILAQSETSHPFLVGQEPPFLRVAPRAPRFATPALQPRSLPQPPPS